MTCQVIIFWGRWRPSWEEFKRQLKEIRLKVLNYLYYISRSPCSPAGLDSGGNSRVERLMTHFLSSAVFFHFSSTIISTALKTWKALPKRIVLMCYCCQLKLLNHRFLKVKSKYALIYFCRCVATPLWKSRVQHWGSSRSRWIFLLMDPNVHLNIHLRNSLKGGKAREKRESCYGLLAQEFGVGEN